MIIMTQRDYDIIQTVDTLRLLSATQIEKLFYSSQQAQSSRCKKLVDHKKLKRFRKDNWSPYLYYLGKKPKQVQSILAISEFYTKCITNGFNVIYIEREKPFVFGEGKFTLIPDAVITIEKDNVEYEFFIEVDNTKELTTAKYYRAFKEYGFLPPPIISISNRRRRDIFKELEVIKLKLDLEDFERVFMSYF